MRRAIALAVLLLGVAPALEGCLVGDGYTDVADGGLGQGASAGSAGSAGAGVGGSSGSAGAGATGGGTGGSGGTGGTGGSGATGGSAATGGSGGSTASECSGADLTRCSGSAAWAPCCRLDGKCGYRNDRGDCQATPACADPVSCASGTCCAGPAGGCTVTACTASDAGSEAGTCRPELCSTGEYLAACCQASDECGVQMGVTCAPDAVCAPARCGGAMACCTTGPLSVCGTADPTGACRPNALPCGAAVCEAAWVATSPLTAAVLAPPCCGPGQSCGNAPDGTCEPDACGPCGALGPNACCRTWDATCGVLDAQRRCVPPCVGLTCVELGRNCGWQSDSCGNLIDCGTCTSPASCGGNGTPGTCGCPPTSCLQIGAACGWVADGCSGPALDCGATCSAPATCGGGGVLNQCGVGTCTLRTCQQAGASCGQIGDGCAGVLSCGVCTAPATCGGGGIPNQCG